MHIKAIWLIQPCVFIVLVHARHLVALNYQNCLTSWMHADQPSSTLR